MKLNWSAEKEKLFTRFLQGIKQRKNEKGGRKMKAKVILSALFLTVFLFHTSSYALTQEQVRGICINTQKVLKTFYLFEHIQPFDFTKFETRVAVNSFLGSAAGLFRQRHGSFTLVFRSLAAKGYRLNQTSDYEHAIYAFAQLPAHLKAFAYFLFNAKSCSMHKREKDMTVYSLLFTIVPRFQNFEPIKTPFTQLFAGEFLLEDFLRNMNFHSLGCSMHPDAYKFFVCTLNENMSCLRKIERRHQKFYKEIKQELLFISKKCLGK